MQQSRKHQVPDVIDTIGRRMERLEDIGSIPSDAAQSIETQPAAAPSSVNRARFGAMTARLAQVAAKASADAWRSRRARTTRCRWIMSCVS